MDVTISVFAGKQQVTLDEKFPNITVNTNTFLRHKNLSTILTLQEFQTVGYPIKFCQKYLQLNFFNNAVFLFIVSFSTFTFVC